MTKNILHALKKFLRIGVVTVMITSGSINASAQENIPELCPASCYSELDASLDKSGYTLIDPKAVWAESFNEVCFPMLERIVIQVEGGKKVTQDVTINKHTVSTVSALLDCSSVGQDLKYTVTKYYSNGNVNSCWGNLKVEDEKRPTITASDLTISCTENIDPYQLKKTYKKSFPWIADNCGTPTLKFQDIVEDYECSNPDYLKIIRRVWSATDNHGNWKDFTQKILVKKADDLDVQFPTHLDNDNATALYLPNPNLKTSNTGEPTLFGSNIKDCPTCNYTTDYEDQKVDIIGGGFKVFRNWTVVNWCTNEILTYTQIIEVREKVEMSKRLSARSEK